ncbi:MAG: hypothetical protein WCS52_02275 [bacterium]
MNGLIRWVQKYEQSGLTLVANKVVLGLIRHMLTIGGGFFINQGVMDNNEQETAIAAIITLIGVAWSVLVKMSAKQKAEGSEIQSKSGEIVLALLVGVSVIAAGLSWITTSHNAQLAVEQREGKMYAGVRSSFGPGVVGAVSASPGASLATIAAGVAAGYAANQSSGGSKDKPSVSVNGNGNNVNYNGSSGTQNTSTDNSTKTGP